MLDHLTSSAEDPEALKARGIDVGPLDGVIGGDGVRSGIEGGMDSGWGSVEAAHRGFGGGEQLGKRDASRQPREGSRTCYARDLGESSASGVWGRAPLVGGSRTFISVAAACGGESCA